MTKRSGIVKKTELRRVMDILREKGVALGSLDLLPGGEVRLNLAAAGSKSGNPELVAEVQSWDEALG
ncbi:hypothetical protein D3C80_1117520 [compost metagenome]